VEVFLIIMEDMFDQGEDLPNISQLKLILMDKFDDFDNRRLEYYFITPFERGFSRIQHFEVRFEGFYQ
jgi:hypothetical protein